MNWRKRYAHEGLPPNDLEALVGHLIDKHSYPAENMRNLLKDYASTKTPFSEVYTELNTHHHYYDHKE